MLTEWGYEVVGDLFPIFDDATADEFAVAFANAAIRNYCGWHVAPPAICKARLDGERYGHVSLPATKVTAVHSVKDNGEEVDFEFDMATALVRRADRKPFSDSWGAVEVEYTAGVDELPLKAVAKRLVEMASGSQGVRSETIGSASVTYADTEAALTDGMKAALAPYKRTVRP